MVGSMASMSETLDIYGERAVNDLGNGRNVKVSQFIENGIWKVPKNATHELMDICNLICSTQGPACEFEDEVICTASENGSFTLGSAIQVSDAIPTIGGTTFGSVVASRSIRFVCGWP